MFPQEFMRMMGLPGYLNWLSWFLVCLVSATVTNLVCIEILKKLNSNSLRNELFSAQIVTALLSINFSGDGAVIENTNFFVTFLLLEIYCFALIFFVFALSTLFNNGKRHIIFLENEIRSLKNNLNHPDGEACERLVFRKLKLSFTNSLLLKTLIFYNNVCCFPHTYA